MKCLSCGNTNPSGNLFCNQCGNRLLPQGKPTGIYAKKFGRQPVQKTHHGLFSWLRRKSRECREAFQESLQLGVVGKLPAVWGRSFNRVRQCGTICLSCGGHVVIVMPLAPSSQQAPQLVVKHVCVYCGSCLYAMATEDSKYLIGTDCMLSDNRVLLVHATKLDIQEGANLSEYDGELLDATPLAVLPGRDGKLALFSAMDLNQGV